MIFKCICVFFLIQKKPFNEIDTKGNLKRTQNKNEKELEKGKVKVNKIKWQHAPISGQFNTYLTD